MLPSFPRWLVVIPGVHGLLGIPGRQSQTLFPLAPAAPGGSAAGASKAARRMLAGSRRAGRPRGQRDVAAPECGLSSAAELTAFIAERWDFTIGGACFPEIHPEAPSLEADLAYLKTKVDAGARFLITQLFFDNRVYFDFVAA